MSQSASRSVPPSPEVVDLLVTALGQEKRAGLSEMLRCVAKAVDAIGCILWQESPTVNQLFVLADGFLVPERSAVHNLSLLQSATGAAILENTTVTVDDVQSDARVYRYDPFLHKAGIRCFCSVPLTFADGTRGALNAYRTSAIPFSVVDQEKLAALSRLLPILYETIIDKVSYGLVRQVNQRLQEVQPRREGPALSSFQKTARDICRCIANAFEALEVSLFLEDRLEEPGTYYLAATTWPEKRKFAKSLYVAHPNEGLTGWVLANKKSIRIFDLAHFDRERYRLQTTYPGIAWKDSLKIEASIRRFLRVPSGQNLQPISFIAVPVTSGGSLLGALRCCTALGGPYYFAERELKLLELVADQIAQAWSDQLNRKQIEEENRTWKALVDSVRNMNRFVARHVSEEGDPKEEEIFKKALEVTNSVIRGAEISDVRLLDKDEQYLHFAATHGTAWQLGKPSEIESRRARRFYLNEASPCGGAYVIKTGEPYLIPDTRDPAYHYSETFAGTRRMIIAPIGVAGKKFGVLDIRGTGDRVFPPYAEDMADLLGQQLGLYHYLVTTITKLQRMQREQVQTFEDFAHQLKSPILQVHARIQSCLRFANQELCTIDLLKNHLFAIRGLASKAKRVSQGLRLYADLAHKDKLRAAGSRIYTDFLEKTLVELAIDQESTLDPSRKIRFLVVRGAGFDALRTHKVLADFNLLLQAINNLLDNAAKYSFGNSVVSIVTGLTTSGRFQITVMNRGLPISIEDAKSSRSRGWRSARAKEVTGEGSGIGLWIVDHIMQAHDGELLILPTTVDGWTEVKLIFPAEPIK